MIGYLRCRLNRANSDKPSRLPMTCNRDVRFLAEDTFFPSSTLLRVSEAPTRVSDDDNRNGSERSTTSPPFWLRSRI
jgi:hypothetical protein